MVEQKAKLKWKKYLFFEALQQQQQLKQQLLTAASF